MKACCLECKNHFIIFLFIGSAIHRKYADYLDTLLNGKISVFLFVGANKVDYTFLLLEVYKEILHNIHAENRQT
jgi:hypothetical protein